MIFSDIIKIAFLWPFSLLYGLIMELRVGAYKAGLFRGHKAAVPVISIGNITVGGTGKTPMAIYVAQILMGQGFRTAVLSRGYKRKSKTNPSASLRARNQKQKTLVVSDGISVLCQADEAGDEPFLMASRLLGTKERPGALVIVGRDRAAGAEKAVELGAQVIVLDDGFQHLRLKRDLDIVLLDDGQRPYDNGWLLPAGMLREPVRALRRAGAIVLTRCNNQNSEFRIQNSEAAMFKTRHNAGLPYGFADSLSADMDKLKKARIILFSGIAKPGSFEQIVRQAGLSFATHIKYPDHHHYTRENLKQITGMAQGCDYLLTTEKDAVKLPPGLDLGKPLLVLPVEIGFMDEAQQQIFNQLVLDGAKLK
ncbi:tetraacyldisaccharide 4'-kinase [candidate division TA06 bacterium]|nr:tetraacyldisaccharide 4'-kinase [candidate division TA06 bacterium]